MTTNINPFARVAPADGSTNIHHFINGRLQAGTSQSLAEVYNPGSGQISGRLSFATKAEVDLAVSASAKAFPNWSAVPAVRRARILFRFRELVEREKNRLA